MKCCKSLRSFFYISALVISVSSCEKVNIEFGDPLLAANDPNIINLDNYKVDIATYKLDSFITSSTGTMSAGYHSDPVFGVVKAGSYAQVNMPAANPVANQTIPVVFDSLELILKASGNFYGDSSIPIKINIHRLTQNITDPNGNDLYYNCNSFGFDPVPIGQKTINLYGRAGSYIHMRLSDALGQELLTKFKANDDDISTAERFINYFKGIYITGDTTVSNSISFFQAPADSVFIRLTYHDNGLFPEKKLIDFTYKSQKQFNSISFRHSNPDFASFINKKAQLIQSTASGNKAFLNTNLGAYIHITFPGILNLKELHPYIKVIKAELVIRPDSRSYSYPYVLPGSLNLYQTDSYNMPITPLYTISATPQIQTGNLFIDNLYGENTQYSYDISSYINTLISEGRFSTSALLLYPSAADLSGSLQRLIVKDQTNARSVQLKLYVLGL